jgi:hypothetical protein
MHGSTGEKSSLLLHDVDEPGFEKELTGADALAMAPIEHAVKAIAKALEKHGFDAWRAAGDQRYAVVAVREL